MHTSLKVTYFSLERTDLLCLSIQPLIYFKENSLILTFQPEVLRHRYFYEVDFLHFLLIDENSPLIYYQLYQLFLFLIQYEHELLALLDYELLALLVALNFLLVELSHEEYLLPSLVSFLHHLQELLPLVQPSV